MAVVGERPPMVAARFRQLRGDAEPRRIVGGEHDVGESPAAAAADVQVGLEAADQLVLAQQREQLVARNLPDEPDRTAARCAVPSAAWSSRRAAFSNESAP